MAFSGFSVRSVEVRDKTGASKGTLSGKVKLRAGSGVSIKSSENVITISTGREYTSPDDCYLRKLNAIIEGGTGDECDGDGTYTFSGMPYYIGAINGERGGEVNNYDVHGSACGQVGIWDGTSIMSGGALPILDICAACIDCQDYEDIKELMEQIRVFQYWDVQRNLYTDVGVPGNSSEEPAPEEGEGELALFRQYQATVHYWNFLVHEQAIPLELIRGSKRYFGIESGYFLKDCSDRTVTQTISVVIVWEGAAADYVDFKITNVKTHLGNELPPPPYSVNQVSGTQYTITVEYPTLAYREFYTWQMVARPVDEDDPENLLEFSIIEATSVWSGTHIPGTPSRFRRLIL